MRTFREGGGEQFKLVDVLALGKSDLGMGKDVTVARNPDVERWQQEDAHDQGRHESADDYDREGALRVRANGVRHSGGQQAQGGNQQGA